MSEPQVLHEAEELGQSREEKFSEVFVVATRTALKALGISLLWGSVITGGRLLFGDTLSVLSVAVTYGGIWAIAFGFNISEDLDEHREGLRSQRSARSYAPLSPQPEPEPPHPPILVHPYKGEPYTIGQPERPLLPGRQEALQITPDFVAELLQAVIEQYGGEWSRRKLTALRVCGQKVTRGTWRELTTWLYRAGVLQQTRQGGFTLPPDVTDFEDLAAYFPNLPRLAGPGGQLAGPDTGEDLDHLGGAERARARWLQQQEEMGNDL